MVPAPPSMAAGGRPSAACSMVLSEYRSDLTLLFNHFCGSNASLSHAGLVAFCEAFDICPGYLSAEKLEEVFADSVRAVGRSSKLGGRITGTLSFADFQDCLALLAKAFTDKQWKVEYSAEKAARYRYTLKDAEKSRVEPGPEERLEGLLVALEIHNAAAYRKRAGLPPPPPPPQLAAEPAEKGGASPGGASTGSSPGKGAGGSRGRMYGGG